VNRFLTSILIPTYNRSHEISKLVHYAARNFDLSLVKFFVLDGSDNDKEIAANKSACKRNKIEYHHYGSETPYSMSLTQEKYFDILDSYDKVIVIRKPIFNYFYSPPSFSGRPINTFFSKHICNMFFNIPSMESFLKLKHLQPN
jgi:hypothetical protein